jgi:hypothetical protein
MATIDYAEDLSLVISIAFSLDLRCRHRLGDDVNSITELADRLCSVFLSKTSYSYCQSRI